MTKSMRTPSLSTLGMGSVLETVQRGRAATSTGDLVDRVFGPAGKRGALVISGANGIVGAGKTMQLGSRLQRHGVPIVALDLPNAPDGIGRQYPGLVAAFGRAGADEIMGGITRMSYDGKSLPARLKEYHPRFLLEAIPEILELKRAHYEVFRRDFPDIEIRSVTSGFPSSELGVGIAHPAFPHEINKVFEVVEDAPSAITQLLWSLGLLPIPVADRWSFVLDVLFCGLTLSALRYHGAVNMPYWKVDKFTRRLVGPNPLRAHDAIGAKGANFLTWSCLHHLSEHYGDVFTPTRDLTERKDSGQNWYPPNHFRPLVNWSLDAEDNDAFETWILGPLFQMASLMVHENRGTLEHLNIIGELCAQFRSGVLAMVRRRGAADVIQTVKSYHRLHPEAAKRAWHPAAFERLGDADWQQLYVNAEHDGKVGAITIGREAYNHDVDAELNRAIDWLKGEGIERVVLTGDFHLSTQMVGADTGEFFPALDDTEAGYAVSHAWSKTARRLSDDFKVSVGFIAGKRCLGGFLELMSHCHHLVAVEDAQLGFPEVTLPVVPGMEGCHWPFRRTAPENWPRLLQLLLEGKRVPASKAVGWLVDTSAPFEQCLKAVSAFLSGDDGGATRTPLEMGALRGVPTDVPGLAPGDDAGGDAGLEAARRAIAQTVAAACGTTLADALEKQARHSAAFMAGPLCRKGVVGTEAAKTLNV